MDDLKDLREIAYFGIAFAQAGEKSLADKKFSLGDAANFWEPISMLGEAVDGGKDAYTQWIGATDDQKARLIDDCKEKFDLENDGIEEFFESCMDSTLSLVKTFQLGKKAFTSAE